MKNVAIILFMFQSVFAQLQTVEFYVFDRHSKEPVPFTLCYLKNSQLSATSFENGYTVFQLSEKYMSDSMVVQHLSYNTVKVLPTQILDTIFLTKKENQITEVRITALSAEQILLKAIEAIEKNYNQSTFYQYGKYRQTHLENSQHVRFIEAKCVVEYLGGNKLSQKEKFMIQELRRSYNFETNGEQHGDHLVDLFQENAVRYLYAQILNPKNLKQYNWEIESSSNEIYAIHFNNKFKTDELSTTGWISINTIDFAVLEYKVYHTTSAYYNTKSNWKLKTDFVHFVYKKEGQYYNLVSADKRYVHEVFHPITLSNPSLIEERFSWQKLDTTIEKIPKNFKLQTNLYSQNYQYKPENWVTIEIDPTIIDDLSKKIPLEKQF